MAKAKKTKELTNFREPAKEVKVHHPSIQVPDSKQVELIERRYQAVQLRKEGHTIQSIAQILECSVGTVRNDLMNVLSQTVNETLETDEEMRVIQLGRFDDMLKAVYPFATRYSNQVYIHPITSREVVIEVPPDPKYVQVALNIEAQRAKLLALNKQENKAETPSGIREYVGVNIDEV